MFIFAIDIYKHIVYYSVVSDTLNKYQEGSNTMNNRVYGYARVSTKEQNLDRQIKALEAYGIDERDIIKDKASGKNFDREGYKRLVNPQMLREGDTIVIMSIDRLGRNYTEIKEQWEYITKELKANIKVLDMPLLDTTQNTNDLDKTFIADLTLQILSYVAQKEREKIKERQQQGIDAMKVNEEGKKVSNKTGRTVGRPKVEYPTEWEAVYKEWKQGNITATKAMQTLDLKRNTFYNLVKRYEEA